MCYGLVALTVGLLGGSSICRADDRLPGDFRRSPAVWGGIGGAQNRTSCGALSRLPVVLVHGERQGPEVWFQGEGKGLVRALTGAGFGPCEIWAVRLGQSGQPLRSLEELTDDIKFFIINVLAYTRAPKVQLVAMAEAAVLVHGALAKYHIHHLVDGVVYVQAPFSGKVGCTAAAALAGDTLCAALSPGASFLRRCLWPEQAPRALTAVIDGGRRGHLRYLTMGRSPPDDPWQRQAGPGGWALAGAWNLTLPGTKGAARFGSLAELGRGEARDLIVQFLNRPSRLCGAAEDMDGDGFCGAAAGGNDCDDHDPKVFPGAPEVEADGRDQDCNGHDLDRRQAGWKCERPLTGPPPPVVAQQAPPPPRSSKTLPRQQDDFASKGTPAKAEMGAGPVPALMSSANDARWMGWTGAVLMLLGGLLMLLGRRLTRKR